jgi:hypothetical protein
VRLRGLPVREPRDDRLGKAWGVASTRQGMARALFQARTTGVVYVTVRVDSATQEARITVASRLAPAGE